MDLLRKPLAASKIQRIYPAVFILLSVVEMIIAQSEAKIYSAAFESIPGRIRNHNFESNSGGKGAAALKAGLYEEECHI